MSGLEALDAQMRRTPDQQILLTDPDGRSIATVGRGLSMTSNAKEGRFGKQGFAYLPDEDVYRCPSRQLLLYHCTNIERDWRCAVTGRQQRAKAARSESMYVVQAAGRITRWEHELVVQEDQKRPRFQSQGHADAARQGTSGPRQGSH